MLCGPEEFSQRRGGGSLWTTIKFKLEDAMNVSRVHAQAAAAEGWMGSPLACQSAIAWLCSNGTVHEAKQATWGTLQRTGSLDHAMNQQRPTRS